MSRRIHLAIFAVLSAISAPALADTIQTVLYKHPQCGCCET